MTLQGSGEENFDNNENLSQGPPRGRHLGARILLFETPARAYP